MSVDILYVSWNRAAFAQASFKALLENTDWTQVRALHVHDDGSTDGAAEPIQHALYRVPSTVEVMFESRRLGGPVAAMNRHLDRFKETDEVQAFVKIDSDFVVCPGWLPELLETANHDPGVDFLGVQPRFGPPVPPSFERFADGCRHIGGIGFMRYRAFDVCRPAPNGRYGFTEFQTRHRESRKAWLSPDLPCFSLDLIDLEPWATLSAEYVANGWQREWPQYIAGGRDYYSWWVQ